MHYGRGLLGLVVVVILLAVYFFPAVIAYRRNHQGMLAIVLLNLLLGWTGVGWLGALAWASNDK
jgi:hypothetical protein